MERRQGADAFGVAASGRSVVRVGGEVFGLPRFETLDALLRQPRAVWLETIHAIEERHAAGDLEPIAERELRMPFSVGDYVDFYSSLEHATNLGRMFRPDGDPLLPNWRQMPVGYHGRASTVVVSGTPIRRPAGHLGPERFGPTEALDIELELGFVMGGPPNPLGQPIPIGDAAERIFGVVLLNDWSARDIQRFEYQPLGPFLGKAFATSISPWVVPVTALESRRTGDDGWNFDIDLEVHLNGERIAATNSRGIYWSAAQQLAHLASGGAIVRPGDLHGTGTISGATPDACGSLIEMGRPFLADGDEVVMTGSAGDVSLGEVRGVITG